MALILKDRVKETSTTTGTGTLTLGGAVTGYQSFGSAIGNGNTTYYAIYLDGGSEWEVGLGTVGSGTLARTTVYASSNGGSLVDFSAGQKSVWGDYPATKAVYADASNKLRVDGNAYVDFEDASGTTVAAGRMWYNNSTGSWNLGMGGGNITQQVGEELFLYGKASSAITDSPLQIIYQTGTVGASGVVTFAPTVSGITDGNLIVGIATESLALNAFGRVTTFGVVHGVTTDGSAYGETWADGDVIWYNPTTGNPTKTKPSAPNIKVQVGTVINAGSGGSGSFQVEINHGSVLGGTDSNVQLTSPSAAQILTYDSANAYWKNTSLASGTGISTSTASNGTLTVTNTAPDQTVAISSGTGISVSGTYPNFTVTNTAPSSGGTVTSVSGTAPIASSGGNTPTISISQASGTTNGYLSSTDWTTFNNKQPAGTYVTSVGATSPVTSSGGTTPTIAIPQATGSVSGYLSSTDWTTFNSKASAFTYTSTYVPFGQGTTTPNQSSSFTYDANNTLNAPQVNASNGIHVNSATIATTYSIPSGSNAMSAGPVSIANGVTVTIPNGNAWVIV